jgi:hypothetical protein
MKYLRTVGPADFCSVDVEPACELPGYKGWAV